MKKWFTCIVDRWDVQRQLVSASAEFSCPDERKRFQEIVTLITTHFIFTCNCVGTGNILMLGKVDLLLRVRRLEALPRISTYLNRLDNYYTALLPSLKDRKAASSLLSTRVGCTSCCATVRLAEYLSCLYPS
jgi:hypothetical protein